MNRVLLNIKIQSDEMGKSEKRIAEWILAHPTEIFPLSISELAEKSGSSEATIVRFSKRLGFEGYQDLKISIAQETNARTESENISKDDSCYEIFGKACSDIYVTLEKTKKSLSPKALEAAAQAVMAADKIIIIGLGNSASIALDASHKLLRAGCCAYSYSDNHMQAIAASHLTARDVVIAISHSGSSRDIVDTLKIARDRGATTVSITGKAKSPIIRQSDIVLLTDAEETKFSLLALSSRIAQLAIIDAIYFYIVYKNDSTFEAIRNTELSLLSKKY